MDKGQAAKAAADIALGAGGMTSPAWMPVLHNANEVLASIAALGGAVLVLIRLYFAFLSWRQYRRNGRIPRFFED